MIANKRMFVKQEIKFEWMFGISGRIRTCNFGFGDRRFSHLKLRLRIWHGHQDLNPNLTGLEAVVLH
jgi:hypothetical protein